MSSSENFPSLHEDIMQVLLTEEQIRKRVEELSQEINRDYWGKNPILVSILKGSTIFLADLIRKLPFPIYLDFMVVSSYGTSTRTSGIVKIVVDLKKSIEGEYVLIVEDIVDSGLTLKYMREHLLLRKPASLKICALLDKVEARQVNVPIDYRGFIIPSEFVVGYGLDYNERYRNLPYVGILKPNIYQRENIVNH